MIQTREKTKTKFIGVKFGRLTISEWSRTIKGRIYFKCLCDCGKYTETGIDRLKSGKTKSCGCIIIENNNKRKGVKWNDLDARRNPNKRLYRIHRGIMERCYNQNIINYNIYGGRGIKVCNDWHNRNLFVEWALSNGYSNSLTIDRIDTNGDYEPSNCRWATYKEQGNNTRRNKILSHNGIELTYVQWSEKMGYSKNLVGERIRKGWSVHDAIETPPLSDGYTRNKKVFVFENPAKIGHYIRKADRRK
jgi:hypothetical protein